MFATVLASLHAGKQMKKPALKVKGAGLRKHQKRWWKKIEKNKEKNKLYFTKSADAREATAVDNSNRRNLIWVGVKRFFGRLICQIKTHIGTNPSAIAKIASFRNSSLS